MISAQTKRERGQPMSYLNAVRLHFSGSFQADVSTVNNDVRHFDVANFQRPAGSPETWPRGSG